MGYHIERTANDSIQALCQLFKDVFHQDINPAKWQWKYHDPALIGHENVILHDDAGTILGHGGALILDGWIEGKPVPVAQICDVMLAKQARGHAGHTGPYAAFMTGLFKALQTRFPEGMYYGFPGIRPFQLGQRLGFYRSTGQIYEWRLPIQPAKSPRWPWWHLMEMGWDDPRLDRLWSQRAATSNGILVLDRRYLSWRYARNPFHTYRLFGIRSGLHLVGWVIVSQTGDLLRCIDRLIDENHLATLLMLLARYGYAISCRELAWWAPVKAALSEGASSVDTGMIGTIVTASAPRFAMTMPQWQPGNVDIY